MQTVLVTGGAGFIGSAVVRRLAGPRAVVNLDALTYAADLDAVAGAVDASGYAFLRADIRDAETVRAVFAAHDPDAVLHLAAESHVDRSIDGPQAFVTTNVVGTAVLLEAARAHWEALPAARRDAFRFVHVSTDEVYGALGEAGAFTAASPYDPSSPYSASKAASDPLARAWHRTYGLPTIVTHCSNNYGPWQHAEKLIPTVVRRAAAGAPIPVYGTGRNVRDWIYVDDHVDALVAALDRGTPGATYLVGARTERTTLDIVGAVCDRLDVVRPAGAPHRDLVAFVADRPGHDWRYAIDPSETERALGWAPRTSFEAGIAATVDWHLARAEREAA